VPDDASGFEQPKLNTLEDTEPIPFDES
jgi:hypothetical protein